MKALSIRNLLYTALLLSCGFSAFSQHTKPEHRFAIRCNTLAILNLSGVLELEYSVSNHVGVFIGGGMGKQDVYPTGLQIFRQRESLYCQISGQGIYGGGRLGIPIWKLAGLSVKGVVQYTYYHAEGFGCNPTFDTPPLLDPYIINTLSSFVAVAYAQTFLRKYFVEPLIGFGPYWSSTNGKREITHQYWRSAIQLNLGVKF